MPTAPWDDGETGRHSRLCIGAGGSETAAGMRSNSVNSCTRMTTPSQAARRRAEGVETGRARPTCASIRSRHSPDHKRANGAVAKAIVVRKSAALTRRPSSSLGHPTKHRPLCAEPAQRFTLAGSWDLRAARAETSTRRPFRRRPASGCCRIRDRHQSRRAAAPAFRCW